MSGRRSQQGRRHAERDRRHALAPRRRREREVARRLAGENGDRVLEALAVGAHRRQRRARRQQLGLRLQHVGLGDDAGGIAVLRDLQRALVALDRPRQQVGLEVGLAQREVVDRQRALRREARRSEVGGAALLAGARALDRARDAAPEVGRPVAVERGGEGVGGAGAAAAVDRRAVAAAEAAPARVDPDAGVVGGARSADQRLRLRVRRDRGGDGLVRGIDLGREAIELGVAEQAPPVAARERVGRRGRQPDRVAGPRRFLVGGRHRRARPLVVGADRARRRARSRAAASATASWRPLDGERRAGRRHRASPCAGAACRGRRRRPASSAASSPGSRSGRR